MNRRRTGTVDQQRQICDFCLRKTYICKECQIRYTVENRTQHISMSIFVPFSLEMLKLNELKLNEISQVDVFSLFINLLTP